MHKFNYFCSVILAITLPLMIVILSSNLVLRMSGSYNFHFNDSQVIDEIPYNVTGQEMAKGISSYFNALNNDEFQVYEQNGHYKDPIFEEKDQIAMKKAKSILNIGFGAGVLCLVVSAAIYIYLLRSGFKEALWNRFRLGIGITTALLIAHGISLCIRPVRLWIYRSLFGAFGKDSILITVIGDPFFKTYLLFALIIGFALLGVLTYASYHLTKPNRIFY